LFTLAEGGRSSPPAVGAGGLYICPVFVGDQRKIGRDCVFMVGGLGVSWMPDTEAIVPIRFLERTGVEDFVLPGVRLALWDGRDIGTAEIVANDLVGTDAI
jgi:hypothetical protein